MNHEEREFEAWFQERRRQTWTAVRDPNDSVEPRPNWSMGLRSALREGWMARAADAETT